MAKNTFKRVHCLKNEVVSEIHVFCCWKSMMQLSSEGSEQIEREHWLLSNTGRDVNCGRAIISY